MPNRKLDLRARLSSIAVLSIVLCYVAESVAGVPSLRCANDGIWLQVLGAGGPEIEDLHASSSYLIWIDGHARVLVDSGGGAPLRFAEAHAKFADLDAIVFTHLHVDHSAGLPALVKSSFLSGRNRDLPVLGPSGNKYLPSMADFLQRLFSKDIGVYPYLHEYISPQHGDYTLVPSVIDITNEELWESFNHPRFNLKAITVHHGPLPALAWRVEIGTKSVTFSGDTSAQHNRLTQLAMDTDIFVAHNAVPQGTKGVARNLHMTPSRIGEIAHEAKVKRVVLSHRMRRTFGQELTTQNAIESRYDGRVEFAEDLSCYEIN